MDTKAFAMTKEHKIVLVGLLFMELVAAIDITGITVMTPTLQNYFKIPTAISGWILMAYLIPFSTLVIPIGYLADRFKNPEKIITWSIFIFCASSAFCGLAPNEYTLVTFRVIKGIGAAGMFACEFAIILKYWKEPRRIVEIAITGLALGVLIGPMIGGLFSSATTWRYFFLIGTVLAGAGFLAYCQLNKLRPIQREADQSEFAKCTGAKRTRMLFNALFWGMVLNFVVSISTQGSNLLITLQVQDVLKKTAVFNGFILSVVALAMVITNVTGLGSRLFPKKSVAVTVSGILIAIILVCLPTTNWTGPLAFILYFLFGVGVGVFVSTIELMALSPLPTAVLAQGNGWLLASMQAGYGIGAAVVPILFLKVGVGGSCLILAVIIMIAVVPFLLAQIKAGK
jgi:MFS transporter, DHA1 family, multidrug resistance protein